MLLILLYFFYVVARLQVTNMALHSAYSNSCIMLAILLRYLRYAKTRSFNSNAASYAYAGRPCFRLHNLPCIRHFVIAITL
jgi:hypothetical protein